MKTITSLCAALLLSGCTEVTLREDFAYSTKQNKEQQVVNPTADLVAGPDHTMDGQKSEQVITRYRTDKGKAASGSLVNP